MCSADLNKSLQGKSCLGTPRVEIQSFESSRSESDKAIQDCSFQCNRCMIVHPLLGVRKTYLFYPNLVEY